MAGARLSLAFLCFVVVVVASALAGGAGARKTVGEYVLRKGDFSVKITNWGATMMSVVLPDSKGTVMSPLLSFFSLWRLCTCVCWSEFAVLVFLQGIWLMLCLA
jgi:hypothetical protein